MKNIFKIKFSRGFTLIELMVVVGLIGVLSSIVFASFGNSRAIARDEIRKTDLKNVQLALALYKSQNGAYPIGCRGNDQWSGSGVNTSFHCGPGVEYISGLTPDFIATLPIDTRYEFTQAGYLYRSDGQDFKLLAHNAVESKFVTSYSEELARCPRSFSTVWCGAIPPVNEYAVYSAGAESW